MSSVLPVRRSRRAARATAALALALVCGFTTACTTGPDLSDDSTTDSCSWMAQPGDGDGRSVILVDDSASAFGASTGARGLDYTSMLASLVADMLERMDTVSIGAFSGDSTQITWIAKDRSTDWKKDNADSGNRDERKREAADCLTGYVSTAQKSAPISSGSNILGALESGAEALNGAKGSRNLLVLTDGLSTTGCADLRTAAFRTPEEIGAISKVCTTRDEIPVLTGVHTTIAGLAQSATDQPTATPLQRGWLTDLWKGLCQNGGGGACSLPSVTFAKAASPRTASKTPSDPTVRYGDGKVQAYSLPGAALFDSGSSKVRSQAMPLLTDIAVSARTTTGSRVVVYGYVDPRGRPDNDHRLSQDRANAVRSVLFDLGVAEVSAYGRGLAVGCPKASGAAGMTEEQLLQCDRRVDIDIIGK
ncbi:OmpA family protein [Streptomyces sp. So13.3]|uniref:OmpA family protein n=1 Tax=Streptomyces sp. So13.3 TaxID=2136173 RepID=UPI0011072568|nr:OmpA family protein [Streptomyces sp. So13.3]QNA75409.1 OmpA family protein [Streptomyces sp. So13.3]